MIKPHYAIIGAGISGLSLAYKLHQHNPQAKITILEQRDRCGGWIDSPIINGFLCEQGPRSLRTQGNGLYTLQLIEELGLTSEVILADPSAKIRYLYEKGSLRALPHSLISLLFSPLLRQLLVAAYRDWRISPGERIDESVYSFAERHFGREIAERFIDPLTLGIYASDCRKLSVHACFPTWAENDRSHGSLIKAAFAKKNKTVSPSPWITAMQKEAIFSFKGGMATLTHALSERLQDMIHLNTSVEKLTLLKNGIEIAINGGTTFFADRVFSTIPPKANYKLLQFEPLNIPSASVAVVSVGYNKAVLKHKGFGYLVPSREKEPVLGVVWDSVVFPQQNTTPGQTRLTVMIDASAAKDFASIAREILQRHLHIDQAPDLLRVQIAADAIPQYQLGHKERIAEGIKHLKAVSPHLSLLGTGFNGVAVNDCIAQAYTIHKR